MIEEKMRTPSVAVAGRLSIEGAPGAMRPLCVIWVMRSGVTETREPPMTDTDAERCCQRRGSRAVA